MSIFREYDIRGIYPEDLSKKVVFSIGYGLGEVLVKKGQKCVFVGYDARVHAKDLLTWLSAGLMAKGIKVFDIGMVPTPVAYFCTFSRFGNVETKSSIMITGSHNPPEYNGFKITIDQKPFYGQEIQELAARLKEIDVPYLNPSSEVQKVDALSPYIEFLTEHFQVLKNFKYPVSLDYGNGVGAVAMSKILENLNIQKIELFKEPDGTFPNHHPDPSEEKNLTHLKSLMKDRQIPIGLAFDGDADRIALLTTNHSYKGDELGILFAQEIAKEKKTPIIIGEVKCSQIMYDKINALGSGVMYKTGHSNLKVKLKELNADLAVEMSGHLFFADRYFGYDDAIYAGLRALELFVESDVKEIEKKIFDLPKSYSTDEEKIAIREEEKFIKIDSLKQKLAQVHTKNNFPKIVEIIDIDGVRVVFENGWGLVRASNTTPVLVTRFEANNEEDLKYYKDSLLSLLHEC